MYRAVFLDRDNTLIANDGDLGDPRKVVLLRGAAAAIASLRGLGFKIAVVTNQGGVARGKYQETDVDAVNYRIAELVKQTSGAAIDRFYYCPFHPEATVAQYKKEHSWRKPNPGMLIQAGRDLEIDLVHSWMIGDQTRDVAAGQAAGTRTIFLTGEKPAAGADHGGADYVARNLVEAARIIAQQPRVDLTRQPPLPRPSPPPEVSIAPAAGELPAGVRETPPMAPAMLAATAPDSISPSSASAESPTEQAPLFADHAASSAPAPADSAPATPAVSPESIAGVEQTVAPSSASEPAVDSVMEPVAAETQPPPASNPFARNITIGLLQFASLVVAMSAFVHMSQPSTFLAWLCGALAIQIAAVLMIWTQPRFSDASSGRAV